MWWLLMAAGLIFISISIFAFVRPLSGYLKLVKYTGISLFGGGLVMQAVAVYNKKYTQEKNWMQAESVLHFLFALILTFNPLLSFIALPYFIGSWILLGGVLKATAALYLCKTYRGWQIVLAAGILSIIFGGILLFSSLVRVGDISIVIGSFGLVMGAAYILDAFRYSKREESLNMML